MDRATFIQKWRNDASASERANKDLFLSQLCRQLDVPEPDPKTGDRARDRYVFEADVIAVHEGGTTTVLQVDLYKEGCFILEAKQGSNPGDAKKGSARRGGDGWATMMSRAHGQAVSYARSMDKRPPFIVVCDIGYVFELYADFDLRGEYLPFPNAQKNKLFFTDLHQHEATLRALFLDPRSLDPSQARLKVTRDVAEDLASVAKYLEKDGHKPDAIAKFLMRCLFTMFAEDVDLLPEGLFTKALEEHWIPKPASFQVGIETLWRAMNDGSPFGFAGQLLRFNGGLFADPWALPVGPDGLELLLTAARRDWSDVEPAIFGTLLERALDPKERHALGAHFTPRAYVERLVRPTVEEPLRTEWENVQAGAYKAAAEGKADKAREDVHQFHQKLCQTRVLDPACGSGNFLYVTLNIFKQIESEVLALLVKLGEKQEQLLRVTPKQFLGIEVKGWAKEIAELVLWIGYLQWHYRSHGKRVPPPQPVLQDFQNIDHRDAVLAWDRIELVRDETGKPVTRWDGETYKRNPVTGEQVPDDKARVTVERYVNPRKAEWPKADYVVGNPPFVGNKRMKLLLGDGYVEALRGVHQGVPEAVDYVMYWWSCAAALSREASIRRFGFITTNSITQTFSRKVVQDYLDGKPAGSLLFAIPDHPWVDSETGAAVRIAMTVGEIGAREGLLARVLKETSGEGLEVEVELGLVHGMLHADLTVGPDVASVLALRANSSLAYMGITLIGEGFRLTEAQAQNLRRSTKKSQAEDGALRPYVMGRDLAQVAEHHYVIDFWGLRETEAQLRHPELFQWVLERVKPSRDQNPRKAYRDRWWVFGEPRDGMRAATSRLARHIATARTARFRVFQFVSAQALVDSNVVAIASDSAAMLGVLSSRLHALWASRRGATLEDRPHYTSSTVFDPFPFPACTATQTERIRELGERLDAHRKARQAAHPDLTITGMYNVLEKLRAGAELTDKDRDIHERGLVSIVKKIHDDLDTAVFDAYGWPADLSDEEILGKLVALNAERAAEEKAGLVRWLRPDFQNPSGKAPETQAPLPGTQEDIEEGPAPESVKAWPKGKGEQLAAVRARVAAPGKVFSVESVSSAFKGAKKKDVEGYLDGFAMIGLLTAFQTPAGKRWRAVGKAE